MNDYRKYIIQAMAKIKKAEDDIDQEPPLMQKGDDDNDSAPSAIDNNQFLPPGTNKEILKDAIIRSILDKMIQKSTESDAQAQNPAPQQGAPDQGGAPEGQEGAPQQDQGQEAMPEGQEDASQEPQEDESQDQSEGPDFNDENGQTEPEPEEDDEEPSGSNMVVGSIRNLKAAGGISLDSQVSEGNLHDVLNSLTKSVDALPDDEEDSDGNEEDLEEKASSFADETKKKVVIKLLDTIKTIVSSEVNAYLKENSSIPILKKNEIANRVAAFILNAKLEPPHEENKEWTKSEWESYKKEYPGTEIKPKFKKEENTQEEDPANQGNNKPVAPTQSQKPEVKPQQKNPKQKQPEKTAPNPEAKPVDPIKKPLVDPKPELKPEAGAPTTPVNTLIDKMTNKPDANAEPPKPEGLPTESHKNSANALLKEHKGNYDKSLSKLKEQYNASEGNPEGQKHIGQQYHHLKDEKEDLDQINSASQAASKSSDGYKTQIKDAWQQYQKQTGKAVSLPEFKDKLVHHLDNRNVDLRKQDLDADQESVVDYLGTPLHQIVNKPKKSEPNSEVSTQTKTPEKEDDTLKLNHEPPKAPKGDITGSSKNYANNILNQYNGDTSSALNHIASDIKKYKGKESGWANMLTHAYYHVKDNAGKKDFFQKQQVLQPKKSEPSTSPEAQAPSQATPEVKPEQTEAPKQPSKPIKYKTEQGSMYHHQDGKTQRNKSDHSEQGHDKSDQGVKAPSDKTYYLDPEHAKALGMHQNLQGAKTAIHIKDGRAYPIAYNEKAKKWGITDSEKEGYPLQEHPEVGKAPLELWNSKSNKSHKKGTYGTWHPGSKITEMLDDSTDTGIPDKSAPKTIGEIVDSENKPAETTPVSSEPPKPEEAKPVDNKSTLEKAHDAFFELPDEKKEEIEKDAKTPEESDKAILDWHKSQQTPTAEDYISKHGENALNKVQEDINSESDFDKKKALSDVHHAVKNHPEFNKAKTPPKSNSNGYVHNPNDYVTKKVDQFYDDMEFTDITNGNKYLYKDLPDHVKMELDEINHKKGIPHHKSLLKDDSASETEPEDDLKLEKILHKPKENAFPEPKSPPKNKEGEEIEHPGYTKEDVDNILNKKHKPSILKKSLNSLKDMFKKHQESDKAEPSKDMKIFQEVLKKKPTVKEFIHKIVDWYDSTKKVKASDLKIDINRIMANNVAENIIKAFKDKDLMKDTGGKSKHKVSPTLKPPRHDLEKRYEKIEDKDLEENGNK